MFDVGFTHIALTVSNMEKSISFYAKYAGMKVVHRRTDPQTYSDVAWISDLTRPFVIVLMKVNGVGNTLLSPCHLGVACAITFSAFSLFEALSLFVVNHVCFIQFMKHFHFLLLSFPLHPLIHFHFLLPSPTVIFTP